MKEFNFGRLGLLLAITTDGVRLLPTVDVVWGDPEGWFISMGWLIFEITFGKKR